MKRARAAKRKAARAAPAPRPHASPAAKGPEVLQDLLAAKRTRIDALHRFEAGRTALLVVDMQRGFLDPGAALEVPAARAIVPAVRSLVDAARAASVPVVFTQFVYAPEVPSLRGDPFGPEHLPAAPGAPTGFGRPSGNCLVGQEGPNSPDVIPELRPRPGELVVRGHTYDKFQGTCLDPALRARDVRCVVLAGIVTEICVNATLMGAAAREYRVTVARDAVAALSPHLQAACLEIWERKFARVVTAAEAAAELRALAGGGRA
jgi:ureidoacrylate peracid hydrolase